MFFAWAHFFSIGFKSRLYGGRNSMQCICLMSVTASLLLGKAAIVKDEADFVYIDDRALLDTRVPEHLLPEQEPGKNHPPLDATAFF